MSEIRHEIIFPSQNMDILFFYSEDNGKYVTPHWHNTLELVYVIEGNVTAILPNDVRLSANDDEFFIVDIGTVHSVLSSKNRAIVFHIPQKIFEKFIPNFKGLSFSADMNPDDPKKATTLELTKKILREIYIIYSVKQDGWSLLFNSKLYELLYSLYRHFSVISLDKKLEHEGAHFLCIKKIIEYIDDHYSEKIKIVDIAENLHYNKDYMSRIFKKYANITLSDYLYMVRLNHVSKDLIETKLPLNEICLRNGCFNYKLFFA